MSLASDLVLALAERGQTVATAESLTAGLVAATIADVPGASAVLRGGIVAYATPLKASLLGVPAEVLARYGAVSQECARAMALGARDRCGSTWAVALTGVAGPAAQEGHPAGHVCLGLAGADSAHSRVVQLPGGRAAVRAGACAAALRWLLDVLREAPLAARG